MVAHALVTHLTLCLIDKSHQKLDVFDHGSTFLAPEHFFVPLGRWFFLLFKFWIDKVLILDDIRFAP